MGILVERPCPFVLHGWCSRPDCQRILNQQCAWFGEVYAVKTSDSTQELREYVHGEVK